MNRPRMGLIGRIQADETKRMRLFQSHPRNPRSIALFFPTRDKRWLSLLGLRL